MLGKLIKYEWKSTCKICTALIVFMLVMTVLGCISLGTPMWNRFGPGRGRVEPLDILGLISLLIYLFSLIGVVWGGMIYIAVHFYRSMYSDQGYLTHTLPVSPNILLGAKIIVGGLWLMLILGGMFLSVTVFLMAMVGMANCMPGQSVWEYFADNWQQIEMQIDSSFRPLGVSLREYMTVMGCCLIFGSLSGTATMFGSITVGQLFSKHKVIMSIISYFLVGVFNQIIATAATMPFMIQYVNITLQPRRGSVSLSMVPYLFISLAVNIIVAVILYFVSQYIIKNKLNLD